MTADQRQCLADSIEASLNYLLAKQRSDGSWSDWDLPPGPSEVWTTAFVGYKLTNLPAKLREETRNSACIGSDWLLRHVFPDGGWGYAEHVGSDADSTALAILFLSSEGEAVPGNCYDRLQQFQGRDGGFSTYCGNNTVDSWVISHSDVTPTALLALLTKPEKDCAALGRGIEFVLKTRTSAGVWDSFWWTSFLYSTEASLSLLNALDRKIAQAATRRRLLATQPDNAFERALLLSSLLYLDPHLRAFDAWPLVGQLVRAQEADGSWQSEGILRITRHHCFEPWKSGDPDQLFSDVNRLFTTSTVLNALARLYALF